MQNRNYLLCGLSVALSIIPIIKVEAQLIPDNTLGKEKSIVNYTDLLQRIDGGAIRGSNLFHSFKEFNIDSGKSVYFSNPSSIQNILTRVTGGNPSSIFGKLGVLGNADLFLLNPNGIIFGKDASLDISGSFTATTLPSRTFNDVFKPSGNNSQAASLLKINITPGLQYPRSPQADIINKGNLAVGKNLNLIGNNLNLAGTLNTGGDLNLKAISDLQIRDSLDNPFIASAGKNLLLKGNLAVDIEAMNHPDSGLFSGNDLVLQSSNPVLGDAHYFSGGNFRIEQLDGSLGNLESPKDPIIRSSGDVSFDSYRGASLHILAGGSVNITGDVTIINTDERNGLEETISLSTTKKLEINGKTRPTLDIRAGTTKFGNPGFIGNLKLKPENFDTKGTVSNSNIFIGGNIEIKRDNGLVFLSNFYSRNPDLSQGNIQIQGEINTSNGGGNGGDVIIDSIGNVDIKNSIRTDSRYKLNAKAGDILINAGSNLRISSNIQANSLGGSSGRISLSSKGMLSIVNGAIIESESNRNDVGNDEVTGADIELSAASILLEDNSQVKTMIGGFGKAGNLIIEAEKVTVNNGSILGSVSGQRFGNSGNIIFINTDNLNLTNGAEIVTETINGISGNIQIQDLESLNLNDNSLISANTVNGQAGNININAADEVRIKNQSRVVSRATGNGNSGSVLIQANSTNLSNGAKISVTTQSGNGGNIQLDNSQTLQLNDDSTISATTTDGNAGNIIISTLDLVNVKNSSKLASEAVGDGIAGNININTNQLRITNNSQANVNSKGNGNAGNISINADDVLLLDKAKISANTTESGTDGNITINSSNSLKLYDSSIGASTANGEAGDIKINSTNMLNLLANSHIASKAKDAGVAGELEITTDKLQITDNSYLNVDSKNNGTAGSILVNANDAILTNQASISATTKSGNGGNIALQNLQTLLLNQDSFISATTVDGKAGDITLKATDSVKLEDSSKIESQATGNGIAGKLNITTNLFQITDNSQVNVNSKGSGNAGSIFIQASDIFLNNQSKIVATTELGTSGDVNLDSSNSLELDKSKISASTVDGTAGNLNINTGNSIKLTGKGGLSVQALQSGTAGSITVNTNQLNITDKAKVNVSSKLGQAGNLNITANNLLLNQGILSAETGIGDATETGSIFLSVKDLLTLENNSLISGKAFSNADGGNITIDNPNGFVIGLPFENSDIKANANTGDGGNIDITTQNILGLQFRRKITSQSDITATSKFGVNGQVTFNQLNVDPSFTLIDFASNLSQEAKIQPGCAASEGNNFVISGRGGLPQSPNDLFSGNTIFAGLVDLVVPEPVASTNYINFNNRIITIDNPKSQIVEANGWIKDINGNVIFVATVPQTSSKKSGVSLASCQNFSAVNK
ncbi:MAG: filamentous hemagglutinin N-terminal domain-containing protein [Cyanobacteria bacterium J06643_5]